MDLAPRRGRRLRGRFTQGARSNPKGRRSSRRSLPIARNPPIVRATALTLLSRYAGAGTIGAIDSAAQDPDPLVRRAAADSLNAIGDGVARARIGGRLLADPVRVVRVEAISALVERAEDATSSAADQRRLTRPSPSFARCNAATPIAPSPS